MKVYLVQDWNNGDCEALLIFADVALADAYVDRQKTAARRRHRTQHEYTIDEIEVMTGLPVEA